jgi:hypothetical protein
MGVKLGLRVFENRVLRRIFVPKRSEGDISREIKLRSLRWAGHVACMGEDRSVYKVLVGKPKGKNHSEDQGIEGRMGLE